MTAANVKRYRQRNGHADAWRVAASDYDALLAAHQALLLECQALRKDAARYRALRPYENLAVEVKVYVPGSGGGFRTMWEDGLDTAIDAQLAALAARSET